MTSRQKHPATDRWRELIEKYLLELISSDESRELEQLLTDHPEAREDLRLRGNIDTALRGEAATLDGEIANASVPTAVQAKPSWRRGQLLKYGMGVACGLLVGVFGTSLVFARFGLQDRLPVVSSVPILRESFESATIKLGRGLPRQVDLWSGDLSAPVGETNGVKPHDGRSMMVLQPNLKRRFSYAYRFIVLDPPSSAKASESRQVEVSASFHGVAPDSEDRYQIRLAAFADGVDEARRIWNSDQLDELSLLHVAKTAVYAKNDVGWKTLRLTMDVPAGARLLLISLAAGVADEAAPKTAHYLDDVAVRMISFEETGR